jgi:asparagine synthase (glutamine-hydrolysing)
MCGIAGMYGVQGSLQDRQALLQKMCASMVHRGPDEDGFFTDETVGLGMRRLSIIDVTGGRQPAATEDKKIQVILNGEIYNFAALRESLQKKGHRFASASDTEVIAHQYEEEGPDCVQRFNGMFAFAVWDARAESLFIARDRLGIKPLFYFWDGKRFLFASEQKALLSAPWLQKHLRADALWDYLTLGYVPQPDTIWSQVHKLLPGHTLTLSRARPEPVIKRYWDISMEEEAERSWEDYSREFSSLFLDAVRTHLVADVPVGILLSGGLDSSAVAAAVKEVHNARLDSFTVAFENSGGLDERPYARQVAQAVQTNYHDVVIGRKEFLDFLPQWVHFMDEPMRDLTSIPLYYVSRLARQNVKVVLSGEGSDEILGGYDFDRVVQRWNRILQYQRLPEGLRKGLLQASRLLGLPWAAALEKAQASLSDRLIAQPPVMTHIFSSAQKQQLFKEKTSARDTLDGFRDQYQRLSGRDPLHQVLYVYCQSWLVDNLLAKADRMTMAASLELRVPFLDHRLVEWLFKAPSHVKVGKNSQGIYETKRLLRDFARARLPPEIIQRPKIGFRVPVYEWLSGPLKSWALDLLTGPSPRLARWLDAREVRRWASQATREDSPLEDQQKLWQLLIFELWLQAWQP